MENIHPVALVLILVNFLISIQGFRDHSFFDRFKFQVESILLRKEYYRLISSGFLHANWMHLFFNMISLFLFSSLVIHAAGIESFLIIYFSSLVAGDLLSLFIHRNHRDYSAIGASGAVNGIIFAAIAIYPDLQLSLLFVPVFIPAWLFGLLYVAFSIYGIKSSQDNIGHDAHLGGAVIGTLTAVLLYPEILKTNFLTILIIVVPAIVFIYIIISRPHVLVMDWTLKNKKGEYFSIDEKYNAEKADRQKEMDRILDKIHQKGINSLTRSEKEFLDKHSGK